MSLGRREALKPTLAWIEGLKSEIGQSTASDEVELLTLPFSEWCRTLRIKTPDGLEPFALFDWQEEASALITGDRKVKGRQIIVLSSRQTGKTSLFLALGGYLAQAVSHFTGVIIHKTGTDSGLLARRLKRFLGGVKPEPDNLSLLGFSSGAFLHFRSSNPNRGEEGAEQCGRGLESVDVCVIEESGHTSNLADVLGVIGPAMTWGNPKLSILIGTAGSKATHYYSLLAESAGGEEQLEALLEGIRQGTEEPFQILNREGPGPIGVISNWRCIPEFAAEPDFLKRIQRELNLSDAQIASEFELVFSAQSDQSCFGFGLVMAAQVEAELYKPASNVLVYVGVDSSGAGADYSVSIAITKQFIDERTIYRVCDLYRQKSGTSELHLGRISEQIKKLNADKCLVETNERGAVWLESLAGMNDLACQVSGFATTASSKPVLIGRLQLALEQGVLQIPKGIIIDELLSFRRFENGKMGASGKAHDDTVIALALALTAAGFNQQPDNNFANIKLAQTTESTADIVDWLRT